MLETCVDYTYDYGLECLYAQGKGCHFLLLRKLYSVIKRLDGTDVQYVLEYRHLSKTCFDSEDMAYDCILSHKRNFLSLKELQSSGVLDELGRVKWGTDMFDSLPCCWV